MSATQRKSKFEGIFDIAKGSSAEGQTDTALAEPATVTSPTIITTERRPGRPAGKRSDPEFTQVTAYIRTGTHLQTKMALLTEGRDRQFSELVQELLKGWLESHR